MAKKAELLKIYETMVRIRRFEEKASQLYYQSLIGASVHLYIGEEAIAATISNFLRKEDYISSTHRGHGHIIAKGARTDKAMAELLGKSTGYCKGRGGSMHIMDIDLGVLGANGIVAGGIPAAVGAGLSIKMQKKDLVSVAYFGDAASNQGAFHEAANMAGVWKLPVIFACENNGYGISVKQKDSTAVTDISVRACAYNMPGYTVEGHDVLAIYDVVDKAVKRARKGEGPSFIEFKTNRWRGHWEGDPQFTRCPDEIQNCMQKCPINKLEEYLTKKLGINKETLMKIENAINEEIDKAAEFAINSPNPDIESVMDGLYC